MKCNQRGACSQGARPAGRRRWPTATPTGRALLRIPGWSEFEPPHCLGREVDLDYIRIPRCCPCNDVAEGAARAAAILSEPGGHEALVFWGHLVDRAGRGPAVYRGQLWRPMEPASAADLAEEFLLRPTPVKRALRLLLRYGYLVTDRV